MATIRLKNLLGIAQRAGFIIAGSNLVLGELNRNNKWGLVLEAADVRPTTSERVRAACLARGLPVKKLVLSKEELGLAIGKSLRGYVMIKNRGIAHCIIALLEEMEEAAHEEDENI